MVDRDLSDAECRVMAAMRKAVLTMPDLCAVGALQDFASLYLKVEPLLTAEMAATMFGAGVFIVWWNNIWESIPFWMVIIKLSVFQTLFMFSTINAYRFFLWNEQNEEMCEKSSTV